MRSQATYAAVVLLLTGSWVSAQEAAPPPKPAGEVWIPSGGDPAGHVVDPSEVPPPRPQPLPPAMSVPASGTKPDPSASSKGAGLLQTLRAVRLKDGEAQVLVEGVPRTLRPGDTIGTDVVRRIDDTRLVLARPQSRGGKGGEATLTVSFGPSGTPRVRIYTMQDPTTSDDRPAVK
jgi:hypothetical protein